jgi:hypothetical protein
MFVKQKRDSNKTCMYVYITLFIPREIKIPDSKTVLSLNCQSTGSTPTIAYDPELIPSTSRPHNPFLSNAS